jgi:hypothetical protein
VHEVIRYALQLLDHGDYDIHEINPWHPFAALLGVSTGNGDLGVRHFLRTQGVDLTALSREFLQFLRGNVTPENRVVWHQARGLTLESVLPSDPATLGSEEQQAKQSPPNTATPSKPEAAPELFISGTPGYTSEFCGIGGTTSVTDNLGVDDLAPLPSSSSLAKPACLSLLVS